MIYINSAVKITGVTDGTSNTLLVGERPPDQTVEFGWMWAGAGYDYAAFGAGDVVLGVRERGVQYPWMPGDPADFYRPGAINEIDKGHERHFWSLHPGGGHWLMADGSVQFITYATGTKVVTRINNIDVTYLEALASRAGGEVASIE